jgi:hypothetical protein
MAERDDLKRRERGLLASQRLEFLVFQCPFDCTQPVRPLGMAGGHQVLQACRMAEQKGGH